MNNRKGLSMIEYNITMVPVANDQLNATMRLYEQGVINAIAAIEMLKAHVLFHQLAFRNQDAIN